MASTLGRKDAQTGERGEGDPGDLGDNNKAQGEGGRSRTSPRGEHPLPGSRRHCF